MIWPVSRRTILVQICTILVRRVRLDLNASPGLHKNEGVISIMPPQSDAHVMAAMKFVVKYFSEIAIKSKRVRGRFICQLKENLRSTLRDIDLEVVATKSWDELLV